MHIKASSKGDLGDGCSRNNSTSFLYLLTLHVYVRTYTSRALWPARSLPLAPFSLLQQQPPSASRIRYRKSRVPFARARVSRCWHVPRALSRSLFWAHCIGREIGCLVLEGGVDVCKEFRAGSCVSGGGGGGRSRGGAVVLFFSSSFGSGAWTVEEGV